jgi:cell division protein FtsW (lipid II flippase)
MSYGGSAIIINLMLVGFSLHAHRHNILKRKI